MKRILISAAILSTVLYSTADAKGCIKGAIIGGLAGHMAGHGKVGAVAGCVIGRHELTKPIPRRRIRPARIHSQKTRANYNAYRSPKFKGFQCPGFSAHPADES